MCGCWLLAGGKERKSKPKERRRSRRLLSGFSCFRLPGRLAARDDDVMKEESWTRPAPAEAPERPPRQRRMPCHCRPGNKRTSSCCRGMPKGDGGRKRMVGRGRIGFVGSGSGGSVPILTWKKKNKKSNNLIISPSKQVTSKEDHFSIKFTNVNFQI